MHYQLMRKLANNATTKLQHIITQQHFNANHVVINIAWFAILSLSAINVKMVMNFIHRMKK